MSAESKTGQLVPTKGSFRNKRRYIKRRTARLARREGKYLLDDANPKRTHGWTD